MSDVNEAPAEAPKSAAQRLDDIEATLDDSACGHIQIRALLNVVRGLLPAEAAKEPPPA